MAFGQASGPPAPAKQLAELAELLDQRGYATFKEARHPFDLTQRQAAGKFTTGEAAELIDRLTAEEAVRTTTSDRPDARPTTRTPARRSAPARSAAAPSSSRREVERQEELVTGLAADVLATELVNRGWCCIPPD